jgi:hypothetical protein
MDAVADGPKTLYSGRKAMTRLSMAGSLLAFVAAALPMTPGTEARAQNLDAHCASVGNDDRVKPIPAALLPEARRLFGGGVGPVRRSASGEHGLSLHERSRSGSATAGRT